MLAYALVLRNGGWAMGTPLATTDPLYRAATTACLAAIVVAQVANVLVCRSDTAPAWRSRPNRLIVVGLAFELLAILAVVYAPAGQALFATAPLAAGTWVVAAGGALVLFVVEELRKAAIRRRA
jgi:sodium/potassium-transporting ATPase subunit alpha